MQRAERKIHPAIPAKIGVGERNRELVVIIPDCGTQKERSGTLQLQHKAGKKSCPVVIEAFFSVLTRPDVTVLIEQRESVAVHQNSNGLVGQTRVGEDVASVLRMARDR